MNDPIEAVVFYFAFVFAVTCHEASHALVAKWGGDLTAYEAGQVSLDPLPHMKREPIGMVVLPLISLVWMGWPFGYASAPYNPQWAMEYPRRAGWMALAGPMANLLLAIGVGLIIRIGATQGWLDAPSAVRFSHIATSSAGELTSALALVLGIFFSMNLLLFALNLIPLPPLDGSGVMLLLLPRKLAWSYQQFIQQPAFGLIGLLLVFNLFGEFFHPLWLACVNLLYPGMWYG